MASRRKLRSWLGHASVLAVLVTATGCVPFVKLYSWQGHKDAMLSLYDTTDSAAAEEQFRLSISAAEERRKVPPGLYAEYAFLLFRRGLYQEAIYYFGRERDLFPESAPFMATVIAKVEKMRDALAASGRETKP